MEELAQQPPEQRDGEDHDDEHRNEAARGGKTLLEVQQRADLGAVAGREPDAEHDARQRADLEDDSPPEAAPHGDEEYQADYQIDRIQKPIVSVCPVKIRKFTEKRQGPTRGIPTGATRPGPAAAAYLKYINKTAASTNHVAQGDVQGIADRAKRLQRQIRPPGLDAAQIRPLHVATVGKFLYSQFVFQP